MPDFGDFCYGLSQSQTLSDVSGTFRNAVEAHGYTVSLCPVVSWSTEPPRFQWLFRNLTPAWARFSDQSNIPVRSPALITARRSFTPFTFVEVFDDPALPEDQRWVWNMTREWGWQNGFVVPVHGPDGYFAYVSIASPERDLDLGPENRARLQMLALLAHDRCRVLAGCGLDSDREARSGSSMVLRERELECMRWVAAGKTDWEIGVILTISASTVRFHVENARRKLDAATRPQAVATLFRRGLL